MAGTCCQAFSSRLGTPTSRLAVGCRRPAARLRRQREEFDLGMRGIVRIVQGTLLAAGRKDLASQFSTRLRSFARQGESQEGESQQSDTATPSTSTP